ncbi:hypothetical protein ACO0TY_30635, partial [Klebsiella pneumoniae]
AIRRQRQMCIRDRVSSDGHIKLRLRRIHDRYKQQFNGKKIRKNQKSSLYKHR